MQKKSSLSSLPHRHHSHSHPHRPTLQKTAALLHSSPHSSSPHNTRQRIHHHRHPHNPPRPTAIRITFDIPAEHNLYASFTVTTPTATPPPLSLPRTRPRRTRTLLQPPLPRPLRRPATTQIVVEFQAAKATCASCPKKSHSTSPPSPHPLHPRPITPPPPRNAPPLRLRAFLTSDLRPLTSPSP